MALRDRIESLKYAALAEARAVPFAPRLVRAIAWAVSLAAVFSVSARELTEYQVGDKVEEDIITPIPLVVVDVEATTARRQEEILKVPVIARLYPNVPAETEREILAAFDAARTNFQAAADRAYRRLPPGEQTPNALAQLVAAFNRTNRTFALSSNLAALWIQGDAGLEVRASIVARLRQLTRRHIRADELPAGLVLSDTFRLIPMGRGNEAATLESAEQRGSVATRTSVATVSRARTLLRNEFPDDERAMGQSIAAFLKPDMAIDEPLTQEARAKHIDRLAVADAYDTGQAVIRRGQVIDKRIKAALDELHEKTAVGRLPFVRAQENDSRALQGQNRFLMGLLAGISLILLFVLWRNMQRKRAGSLLPARIEAGAVQLPAGGDGWQQRALDAERRAETAQAIIRANLEPSLARVLKETLVEGLSQQRRELLEAQQKAAAEVAELVRRLDRIQAPIQERLWAYERRIEELEKALLARTAENRELLRIEIEMTRRQLEAEWRRSRSEVNPERSSGPDFAN